ncbi:MAG: geranylgeranylglycerol-phosphate geranylgeranyltransferase, partial [Calditrichia bacterium]|nr:geranylgeranylglycerol-phosphate geranylgeranyltransferase [Calditrichia bacterium]
MNNIILLIKLSRPANVIISFLTIIIAAELAWGLDPFNNVLLAALSAALITMGANVINDYYDIEIDRINKPNRPLAAGTVSKKTAFIYFIFVYFLAWCLAIYINVWMFLIAFMTSIILFFYSFRLKRTVLWGNLTVSFATAIAFVYGGVAVGHYKETFFPAAFAFLFHLGREILKDIQDMEGDKQAGADTFPVKYGISRSIGLISVDFILLVFLTAIPYILGIYSIRYFMIICFGIYPVLLFVLFRSRKDSDPANLGFLSNLLKA